MISSKIATNKLIIDTAHPMYVTTVKAVYSPVFCRQANYKMTNLNATTYT